MIETILQFLDKFIRFFATNEIALGMTSIIGLVGFILTLVVSFQTTKIKKILQFNQVTEQYNKERAAYRKAFEGHRKSIMEDNIKNDTILKDILTHVEGYRVKFDSLLSKREKSDLRCFVQILKKQSNEVDWNTVCNYLSTLSGRLTKKGDKKNA